MAKKELDPLYDLIMDPDLAKNKYPKAKLDKYRSEKKHSLTAKYCTQEVWDKYKDKKSSGKGEWTLARAINSGVMYPDSFVGCHAGDRESYDDFKDFFYPLMKEYHRGLDIEKCTPLEGTPSSRMDPEKIKVKLSKSATDKIVSTRIRIARNLHAFPLNTGGTKETRLQIADTMKKVYDLIPKDSPLRGEMFLHSTMSDEQRQGLIDDHFLFRGADKMQAASGYHADWPHGRGVFHNKEKTFLNWINEGDHIRIISMKPGSDVLGVFKTLSDGAKAIEDGVKKVLGTDTAFTMHPKFGAVTACPSNCGTGMRGSVHILVPNLIRVWGFEKIDDECRTRRCQARGSSGEHSAVVDRIDISNWRRIGVAESELVTDMIECANWLADEEDKVIAAEISENTRKLVGVIGITAVAIGLYKVFKAFK